jgi:hypothetical protein
MDSSIQKARWILGLLFGLYGLVTIIEVLAS